MLAKVDYALAALRLQGTIKAGPALLLDFGLHARPELRIGSRSQPLSGEFRGAVAHCMTDVIAGDDEIAASLILATKHDVRMRVIGVPMVDGNPLEPGADVRFHALHELPRKRLEVGELRAVFRGDDEAELMPIITTTSLKAFEIGGVGPRVIGLCAVAASANPLPDDVAKMRRDGPWTGMFQHDQPRLDDDTAGPGAQFGAAEAGSHRTAAAFGTTSAR
jgi:hypothetical protein